MEWVDASRGHLPSGAIAMGNDTSGEPLYVARAQHEGALLPGKFIPSHGCAYVSWGGDEHRKTQYQVLVGGSNNWVLCQGGDIPLGAVLGGETEGGEPLPSHEGSVTTGKVQQSHGACYIPFGGKEVRIDLFQVLVN